MFLFSSDNFSISERQEPPLSNLNGCLVKCFSFGWMHNQIQFIQDLHPILSFTSAPRFTALGIRFFPEMQTFTEARDWESIQAVTFCYLNLNLKNMKIWKRCYSTYILEYPPSWSCWWCSLSRSNYVLDAHKSWNPDQQLLTHLQGSCHHQPPPGCL